MAKVPGHAVFRGMREVPPGGIVRVGRSGVTEERYWRLEVAEHTDSLDRTISTVRELMEEIVEAQMVSDVPLCTLLSGGLDSSSLTALAAHAARTAGTGASAPARSATPTRTVRRAPPPTRTTCTPGCSPSTSARNTANCP
nr:asparagine synthase-related protein [Streptomyces sp. C8S0]